MSDNLSTENLTAIAGRLADHADGITQAALRGLANDLRLAARIGEKLATVRRRLANIAPMTTDPAVYDGIAALLRELED
jgi:hypothetical protein